MKKRVFLILLIIPFLLAACSKNDENALQNLSEKELASNQELVTGQVTARVGNDIELALGTIAQAQFPGNIGPMPSGEAGAMSPGDRGAMPSGEAGAMPPGDRGAMPSGKAGAMPPGDRGAMPSGGRGNMNGSDSGSGSTSGGGFPARGNGSAGGAAQEAESSVGTAVDSAAAAGTQIQLSGETMSITIPVGTKVLVTSDGVLSASSFGRIQADDILQLIVQNNADGSQTVTLAQIME